MKRLIFLLIAATISTCVVFAKPPHLNVEKLFDGRYNNNKSVTTSIYKNRGNYYRGMTVAKNPTVLNAIATAIEKDRPKGKDYSDHRDDSGRYTSLKVINNGETIFIGLQRDDKGGGFFFIQGKESAFK